MPLLKPASDTAESGNNSDSTMSSQEQKAFFQIFFQSRLNS
jgi:hypothetical protein